MLQELGITDQDLMVEAKLVTTVYAGGETVLILEEVLDRTRGEHGSGG